MISINSLLTKMDHYKRIILRNGRWKEVKEEADYREISYLEASNTTYFT